MEEQELAIRFIEGGEEELEEVIDTYSKKLLRYATSILCDSHEAEDIVQECFISAYKNKKNFNGDNLSAWLYKITYNLSLNKIRKRKILYFSNIFIKDTYEVKLEDDNYSENTLNALKKLKAKDRALIHARIMDGMSYKEISFQVGVSESTLRKRYERAKDKLVHELNKTRGV